MLTQIGYPPVFFGIAITLLTIFLFLQSIARSALSNPAKSGKQLMIGLFLWLALQAAWGFSGYYRQYDVLPPNIFLFGIGPALATILIFMLFKKLRLGVLKLNLKALTWIHIVRIPVEFGLFYFAQQKVVANEMTFEGRNFDIISGLTTPLIIYLVFTKKVGGKNLLLAWNVLCLALVINIVVTAIFAAPFQFQKFGFDQPNIAVFYFPFVWLPTLIVPLVIFSHIASILKLTNKNFNSTEI